jgi:sugar lactone lactonase YvrE
MPDARVLLSGLAFPESPRWHEGRLWLSDWVAQQVIAVDLDGTSEVMVEIRALPFSIDWLPDGHLLIASGGDRPFLRREADETLVTHAETTHLSPRGWNEIVVDGRGNTYINAAGFDLMGGGEFAPGIVALVAADGSTRQVADDIAFPNGMAVTPDNATLIVADSYAKRLTAFDIGSDGSLSNRRVWADLRGGVPDGICMDAEGAVWYADVPNERCVRVREGGEVLQTIDVDRGCFACMLGGVHGTTLFIMANEWHGVEGMTDASRAGQVLTVEAPAPHAGWP